MRKKELKLTDIPGDYLSKEDFYKIAHISKRTALWLIETELVLAERPEKQGLGYRIPKAEVERYLADKSINPTKYRRSDRCNRYPYCPVQRYTKRLGKEIRTVVEQDIAHLPDVLAPKQCDSWVQSQRNLRLGPDPMIKSLTAVRKTILSEAIFAGFCCFKSIPQYSREVKRTYRTA